MFEEHLSRLSPGSVYLFNKPRNLGVMLHDPSVTVLYENNKIGKHTIAKMVPTMCKISKSEEHFTNHDLRATGLCSLKKAGMFDFEEIKKVSGHKTTKSIEDSYHVGLETKKKSDMMFCILNAAKLGRGEDFEPISGHLMKKDKATPKNEAFSAMNVACPVASSSKEPLPVMLAARQLRVRQDGGKDESDEDGVNDDEETIDDSFDDPEWKYTQANFDLDFQSDSSDDDRPLLSRNKTSKRVSDQQSDKPWKKKCPEQGDDGRHALATSSSWLSVPVSPQPSQPLHQPIRDGHVRAALVELGVHKIALSKINVNQPNIVPLPRDMITNDVLSADLLFIKCVKLGEDDTIDAPVSKGDGNIPIPTLKWTLAKSNNIKVLNGKLLEEWFRTRKPPNFSLESYQTGSVDPDTSEIVMPDPNPNSLFRGWKFKILNFQEEGFTQKNLETIIRNTGGELLPMKAGKEQEALREDVVVLGDGYLDLANKVLCPSYVIQCVQKGRLLSEKDYLYVSPRY